MGSVGEAIASSHLQSKGYRIIAQNYRCKLGEIDIVARQRNILIFCEVKCRQNKEFGEPFEAVTISKQRRLRRLAQYYLLAHPAPGLDYRFDVISIITGMDGKPKEIVHIENAF